MEVIAMTKQYRTRNSASLKERLEARSAPQPNGCVHFVGHRNRDGYGRMSYKRKFQFAHRLSFICHIGEIPVGLHVLHRCDNPPCINPEHLFLGTHADNMADRTRKGRGADRRGVNNVLVKLTENQVIEIRASTKRQRELAVEYGVSLIQISRIRLRKRWIHI